MSHECGTVLITCMDFRIQKYVEDWAYQNIGEKNFDRVAWAGGIYDIDDILKQVGLSKRLHNISRGVLINHEDCGKYGEMGTMRKHTEDLSETRKRILEEYPDLKVETYYLHLDGTFEEII